MAKALVRAALVARDVVDGARRHRLRSRAAALAFYALFAIAPLLVIAVAVAGLAFGRAAAEGEVSTRIESLLGRPAAEMLQEALRRLSPPSTGWAAAAAGFAFLFLGASGFFLQLQEDLNAIWDVRPDAGRALAATLRRRLTAFAMVVGSGFLLLASWAVGTALEAAEQLLPAEPGAPTVLRNGIDLAGSLGTAFVAFALTYRFLPETTVRWRDAAMGGVTAAALFTLGRSVIVFYLARSALASATGAAGSVVAILIWAYASTWILLLGAEIARAWGPSVPRKRRTPLRRAAA